MDNIKKFENFLDKMQGVLNKAKKHGHINVRVKDLESVLFELKESEDEKIRKELIQFIKNWKDPNNIGRPHDFPTLTRNEEQCDRYIAWFEKQKEFVSADFDDVWEPADCDELVAPLEKYSKNAIKEMCHVWYDKGIELERKSWLEKQGGQKPVVIIPKFRIGDNIKTTNEEPLTITKIDGEGYWSEDLFICDFDEECIWDLVEQKPANKIEPKFKPGDWIVSDYNSVAYIESISETKYNLQCKDGNHEKMSIEYVDRCWHLWSIQDAKPGDVLVTDFEDDNIIMYHSMCTKDTINVYCCLDNKFVCGNLGVFDVEDVKPATKKHRDLLFSKMKEAGYVWDSEKKELKKIEENSFESNRVKKALNKAGYEWVEEVHQLKKIEQKSSWSEDDEKMVKDIIAAIDTLYYHGMVNWLKSLKDRIQPHPKQQWSELDEMKLNETLGVITVSDYYTIDAKKEIEDWLKSLKSRVIPQSKQEWSEEDERIYQSIIDDTVQKNQLDNKQIDWLKSIKQRLGDKK